MICNAWIIERTSANGRVVERMSADGGFSMDEMSKTIKRLGANYRLLSERCAGRMKVKISVETEPYTGGAHHTLAVDVRCDKCGGAPVMRSDVPTEYTINDFVQRILDGME